MPLVFRRKYLEQGKNLVGTTLKKLEIFFEQLETLEVQERASGDSNRRKKSGQEKSGANQSRAKRHNSKRIKRERAMAGAMPGRSTNAKQKPTCAICKRAVRPHYVVVSHDTANCKAKPSLSRSNSQDGKGKVQSEKLFATIERLSKQVDRLSRKRRAKHRSNSRKRRRYLSSDSDFSSDSDSG